MLLCHSPKNFEPLKTLSHRHDPPQNQIPHPDYLVPKRTSSSQSELIRLTGQRKWTNVTTVNIQDGDLGAFIRFKWERPIGWINHFYWRRSAWLMRRLTDPARTYIALFTTTTVHHVVANNDSSTYGISSTCVYIARAERRLEAPWTRLSLSRRAKRWRGMTASFWNEICGQDRAGRFK